MSAIWQTIIGAAAALVGGFGAAWWQTSRADSVAQKIRHAERREDGLLTALARLQTITPRFVALREEAEKGWSAAQYQQALKLLDEVWQLWFGRASGMIPDESVIAAYRGLYAAAAAKLPSGSAGAERTNELSNGSEEAGQRFVEDLGVVLWQLTNFQNVVTVVVRGLLD